MKNCIFITLLCIQGIIAQQQVVSFGTKYKGGPSKITESFHLINPDTNELVVFTGKKNKITAHHLGTDFKKTAAINSQELNYIYQSPIGGTVDKNTYTLFLTDINTQKFASISFDFDSKKSIAQEIDFKYSKEKFIQTIKYNNRLFLITIQKKSSNIHFYELDKSGVSNKHTITLADKDFLIEGNAFIKNLYDLMAKGSDGTGFFRKAIDVVKIENRNRNTIGVARKFNKIYHKGDTLFLSLDADKQKTVVIEININNFEHKTTTFFQDKIVTPESFKKSNSYLYKKHVHQIVSSSDTLIYQIKDYMTGNLIKLFNIGKKDAIYFKNTPILQHKESGAFGSSDRELEKTSKFLRKISLQKNGIVVTEQNENFKITLGGEQKQQGGGGAPMMMPGGGMGGMAMGAIGGATIYFNPTAFAYNSYEMSKSIWIDCLFDNQYNHVEGKIEETGFDQIKKLKDDIKKGIVKVNPTEDDKGSYGYITTILAENIFWYNDKLYFGFFQKRDKTYTIFEMTKPIAAIETKNE